MAAFLNFSVHFFSILFFLLILATLVTSHGSNNKYKHCSTMISCGKLQNVGYPFWGLGRPQYCGHPDLQLHCPHNESNEYPVLKGGVEYYYVQSINNRFSRMTIQLLELSWANKSCSFNLSNEFDGIFQETDNVKDMKLFYKCPKNYTRLNHSITRLCHQNLVKLYGCTSRHSQELLLVYEFISKGTVADHLHRNRKGPGTLSWAMRMKIATESASALAYLHASDVIHRDVKTNNILLDESFSVKVADFGLSKLFPIDATHVSTAPQGTPGYLDPNYNKCYQVTNKSDVYSFGVVLVELISSLPRNLLQKLLEEGIELHYDNVY